MLRKSSLTLIFPLLVSLMLPGQATTLDLLETVGEENMSDTNKTRNQPGQKISAAGISYVASNSNSALSGETQSIGAKAKQSYEAPYPFTADELWEKLLKVVELPEGIVSREEVENIFGVRLIFNEEIQKKYHYKSYSVIRGGNWYFNIGISESSKTETTFDFNWGNVPNQKTVVFPPPPLGMCIDAYKIMPSIIQRSWELKREVRNVRDMLNRNDYRKGKMGIMKLEFFPYNNCLASVTIFSSEHADDLIR